MADTTASQPPAPVFYPEPQPVVYVIPLPPEAILQQPQAVPAPDVIKVVGDEETGQVFQHPAPPQPQYLPFSPECKSQRVTVGLCSVSLMIFLIFFVLGGGFLNPIPLVLCGTYVFGIIGALKRNRVLLAISTVFQLGINVVTLYAAGILSFAYLSEINNTTSSVNPIALTVAHFAFVLTPAMFIFFALLSSAKYLFIMRRP